MATRHHREPRIVGDAITMRQVLEGAQRRLIIPLSPQPRWIQGDGLTSSHWQWDGNRNPGPKVTDEWVEHGTDAEFCREMEARGLPPNLEPGVFVQLAEPWIIKSFDLSSNPPSVTIAFAAGGTICYQDASRSFIERHVELVRRRRRGAFPGTVVGTVENEKWYPSNVPWGRSTFLPDWAIRQWLRIDSVQCLRVKDLSQAQLESAGRISEYDFAQYWDRYAAGKSAHYCENPFTWLVDFTLAQDG